MSSDIVPTLLVTMSRIALAHLPQVQRLQAVLMVPSNYSLLFGRVHWTQRPLLESIVHGLVGVRRKTLLAHWRLYGAFAVAMYSTRQARVSANHGSGKKLAYIQTDFVLRQRNMRGLEMVSGIERSTAVTRTGEIVRAAPADPRTVCFARERTDLHLENSAPYRDLTSNKIDPQTALRAAELKKREGWWHRRLRADALRLHWRRSSHHGQRTMVI